MSPVVKAGEHRALRHIATRQSLAVLIQLAVQKHHMAMTIVYRRHRLMGLITGQTPVHKNDMHADSVRVHFKGSAINSRFFGILTLLF